MSSQSNIAVSVVRSVEPDRLQQVNSRAAGLAQDQLAALAVLESTKKKIRASEKVDKSRIKKDKDPEGNASGGHESSHSPAYSADGQSGTVGEDPEGHLIDTFA